MHENIEVALKIDENKSNVNEFMMCAVSLIIGIYITKYKNTCIDGEEYCSDGIKLFN